MSAEMIPIIMVHEFRDALPDYAAVCLGQAKNMQEDSPVYLLSSNGKSPIDSVEAFRISDFEKGVESIKDCFFNISTNSSEFEFSCIKRWFVIRDFMKSRSLTRALCIDSDVMFYGNISTGLSSFSAADYADLNGCNWAICLINNLAVLEAFCELMTKAYNRDPSVWPIIADYLGFSTPYKKLGVLSDMTFVRHMAVFYPEFRHEDLTDIRNGSTFDDNINFISSGYEMENGMKKIQWVEGFPFCYHQKLNSMIRLRALHYQGTMAKGHIWKHFNIFMEALNRTCHSN